MKKTFKISAIIATLIICLTISAFAADFEHCADALNELGLFKGTEKGYELDREPTRAEAATMLVRLLGAEEEALTLSYTAPFKDVADWAKPYVQYLFNNGITKGTSSETFGQTQPCTAQQYAAFLLRALGYSDAEDGDFTYAKALDFAREKCVADGLNCNEDNFLRDHVVAMSYTALSCAPKSGEADLLSKLMASGAVKDAKGYDTTFANLRAVSETILSLNGEKGSNDMSVIICDKLNGETAITTTQKIKAAFISNEEKPEESLLSYKGTIEKKYSDAYAKEAGLSKNEQTVNEEVEYYYANGYLYLTLDGIKVKTAGSFSSAVASFAGVSVMPGAIITSALENIEAKSGSNGETIYNVVLNANVMSAIISESSENINYDKIEYSFTVRNGVCVSYKLALSVSQTDGNDKKTVEIDATLENIITDGNVEIALPKDLDKYIEITE